MTVPLRSSFSPYSIATLIVVNHNTAEGYLNAEGKNAYGKTFPYERKILRIIKQDLDTRELILQHFDTKDETHVPNMPLIDIRRGCILREATQQDKDALFYVRTPKPTMPAENDPRLLSFLNGSYD